MKFRIIIRYLLAALLLTSWCTNVSCSGAPVDAGADAGGHFDHPSTGFGGPIAPQGGTITSVLPTAGGGLVGGGAAGPVTLGLDSAGCATNDTKKWNGTSWVCGSAGGGLTGLTPNALPKATSGTTVADSLLTDDTATLAYNATKFTVAAASGNGAFAGTLTADAGLRLFDTVGPGLARNGTNANEVDLSMAGASCAAGTGVTAISATGTGTCTADVTSVVAGTGISASTTSGAATVTLRINAGTTQTCGAGTAVTALTGVGLTTCTAFGSSSLTNSAGANVIAMSNGANLVASPLVYNGTDTITGPRVYAVSSSSANPVFQATQGGATPSNWWMGSVIGTQTWFLGNDNASTTALTATYAGDVAAQHNFSVLGSTTLGGALDLGTHQIHNVTDGTSTQDAVTLNQLNVATTGEITGTLTSGTVPVASGAHTLGNSSLTDNGVTFAVNTNKFTVTEANGNTNAAGTFTSGSTLTVSAGGVAVTGTSAMQQTTFSSNAVVSATITSNWTGTAVANDRISVIASNTGTYDATAAVRTAYGVKATVNATRSAGTSFVNQIALYGTTVSGTGLVSMALVTAAGDNDLNATSGSTGVGYAIGATLPSKLSVNGTATIVGALDMSTNQIHNVVDGTGSQDAATVHQLTTFGGRSKCTITPSPTVGSIDDMPLTSGCSYIELAITGTATLRGIDATGAADGETIYIHTTPSINFSLAHESGGSLANNRIRTHDATTESFGASVAGALIQCTYDAGSISRWECWGVDRNRYASLVDDGTLTVSGTAGLGTTNITGVTTITTASGAAAGLVINKTQSGATTSGNNVNISNISTWDTTATARITYGLSASCANGITAGTNTLTSVCGYFTNTSSGANINAWALITDVGNVQLNATSGSTEIDGATAINNTLNVTGLVDFGTAGQKVYMGRQPFTATGTYTPTTGTRYIRVTMCGGGGGGGGAKGGAAGGGGGGAYFQKWFTLTSGGTVTIGAAGAAGAATPTNGGNGGDTSVVVNGTTYTAKGGLGSVAASTSGAMIGAVAQTGTSAGDVNNNGQPGAFGQYVTGGAGVSGNGGSSPFGAGGGGVLLSAAGSGIAGTGYCSGGGGGAHASGGAGGAGTGGLVLIDEYR